MEFKGITRDVHGYLDFVYAPALFMAPELFEFERAKEASALCKITAVTVFGYTLTTDAPWGLVKLIPYKVHAAIDLGLGAMSVAAPLVLDIRNKNARATLFIAGITSLVVGALSLYGAYHSDDEDGLSLQA